MREVLQGRFVSASEDLRVELGRLGLRRAKPVGKKVGKAVYAHRDYEGEIVPEDVLSRALKVLEKESPEMAKNYNAVKYDTGEKAVTFQHSPDFDEADEPTVGDSVKIRTNGGVSVTKQKQDPQIWHHKWMWVSDDYRGFDVPASMKRSLQWFKKLKPGESSRIGTKSFWDKIRGRWEEGWRVYYAAMMLLEFRTSLTQDEIDSTVKTCRTGSKGSTWGDKSKLHAWFRDEYKKDAGTILDFGAGNPPTHGMKLRKAGYQIDFYDHGKNFDPAVHTRDALQKKYDIVLASKVLNVQPNPEALQATLSQMRQAVKPDGVLLANYPEPRKIEGKGGKPLSPADVMKVMEKFFKSVKYAKGTSSSPIFIAKLQGQVEESFVASLNESF
jgi:hypothetical protein